MLAVIRLDISVPKPGTSENVAPPSVLRSRPPELKNELVPVEPPAPTRMTLPMATMFLMLAGVGSTSCWPENDKYKF